MRELEAIGDRSGLARACRLMAEAMGPAAGSSR